MRYTKLPLLVAVVLASAVLPFLATAQGVLHVPQFPLLDTEHSPLNGLPNLYEPKGGLYSDILNFSPQCGCSPYTVSAAGEWFNLRNNDAKASVMHKYSVDGSLQLSANHLWRLGMRHLRGMAFADTQNRTIVPTETTLDLGYATMLTPHLKAGATVGAAFVHYNQLKVTPYASLALGYDTTLKALTEQDNFSLRFQVNQLALHTGMPTRMVLGAKYTVSLWDGDGIIGVGTATHIPLRYTTYYAQTQETGLDLLLLKHWSLQASYRSAAFASYKSGQQYWCFAAGYKGTQLACRVSYWRPESVTVRHALGVSLAYGL